jgi:hypothetical protein
MPTAEQFRAIATMLESSSTMLHGSFLGVAESYEARPIRAAQPEAVINWAMGTIRADIDATIAELEAQAAEARRRAMICEDYAEEMRSFIAARDAHRGEQRAWREGGGLGPEPVLRRSPPPTPPSWVAW